VASNLNDSKHTHRPMLLLLPALFSIAWLLSFFAVESRPTVELLLLHCALSYDEIRAYHNNDYDGLDE
jgi:hypothetical protein